MAILSNRYYFCFTKEQAEAEMVEPEFDPMCTWFFPILCVCVCVCLCVCLERERCLFCKRYSLSS